MTDFREVSAPNNPETVSAIQELKNCEVSGSDRIKAEFLKNGEPKVKEYFHRLIQNILSIGKMPEDWHTSVLWPNL